MNKKFNISLVASCIIATNLLSNDTVLDEIVITSATKSNQSIKDVTSNVDVITSQELQERHFTSVNEALNTLAGVDIVSNGSLGSTSSVFLRGMDNNRVLVLIDGVRFQDPSNTSGANLSHLMINDIESIEVVKGAQSGIWGAEAAAGVINIITKKAKKGISASANAEIGSYLTKKIGATASYGAENFDIKLSANHIETDGFSSQTPSGEDPRDYERDGYRNTTLGLDSNIYLSDTTKVNLNVKDINAKVEYDGYNAPNDDTMKSDVDTTLYSASIDQKISNHDIKLKYELSKFKRDEIGTTYGVKNFNGETQNIELSDEIKYLKDSFVIVGGGVSKDDVDYKEVSGTTNDKDSKNKFVYLTNSNSFDNLVFTQSLRYDKYDNFDNQITGKIGAKYYVNSDLNFSANYGTAYNVPSIIKQLNPWGTANLDLQPEKTKGFDIGFEYKDFKATYFNSKVDDLIDWSGTGYENVEGETKFRGVELAYKKALGEDFLLSANYTFLRAKDDDGNTLARRAKHKFGVAIDYYGVDKLHLNLNAQYVGDRQQSVYGVGDVQTGKYTLWNSVINYDFTKNISGYVKVNNIFDKNYQTIYGYGTAGRNAYAGLKVTF